MRAFLIALLFVPVILLSPGCATHPKDFIPNGAALNLEPTNPDHIKVLDSVPRGLVIGTVLVDRSKAHNTNEIIEMARQRAASVGGDFIVWEDSLGTLPSPSASPGDSSPPSSAYDNSLGHSAAMPGPPPEQTVEKTPKARFTVGIFLPEGHRPPGQ